MADVAPRRKKVSLGLVGTGPLWERGYRDAVRRNLHHIAVRGVYDAVPARGDQTAREWQALAAPSLTALFERPDIDAVVILDAAWFGAFPLQLACRFGKPTLLARPCDGKLSQLEQVQRAAQEAGVMIMAAFPRRHTPAMNRLRELIVTRLGSPTSIRLEVAEEAVLDRHHLAELLDWCTYVAGRPPFRVTASPDASCIDLEFPPTAGTPRPGARIVLLRPQKPTGGADGNDVEALHVVCQRGSADIVSDEEIAWRNGEQEVRDNLASERSSAEIILDQFCRRVVGGLVPVSDLSDALRAWRFAEALASQLPS
jgi:hypothetical protein